MFARIYYIILVAFVSILLVGCSKTIDIDVGDFDKRLVINSLIETGEPIKVVLSRSEAVGENLQDRYIQNAVIELYKEDVFVEHLQETVLQDSIYNYYTNQIELSPVKRSIYKSSVLAEEGVSYTLKTGYDGYNDISAETSIPENVEIKGVDFSGLNTIKEYYGENNEFEESYLSGSVYVDIDDPVDEVNYYGVDWFVEYTGVFPVSVYDPATGEYEADTVEQTETYQVYFQLVRGENAIVEDLDLDLGPELPIFSDEDEDVTVNKLRLDVGRIYLSNIDNNDNITDAKHVFYLKNISEDYYRYELTRTRQDYYADNFLAEPVFVYTNVENGLGVFAGMNESAYVVEIK